MTSSPITRLRIAIRRRLRARRALARRLAAKAYWYEVVSRGGLWRVA